MLILYMILLATINPLYIKAMDLADPTSYRKNTKKKTIQLKRKFTFFDPKKVIETGATLTKSFNTNLTLTPDEKKILISTEGKLFQTDVSPPFNNQIITLLFKHPSSKLSTMVAVNQQDDQSNLIVSGANFFDKKNQNWSSEIIIYNDKKKSYTIKYNNWPLQRIKFNQQGTFFAVANTSSIMSFDPEGNITDCAGFHTSNGYQNSFIQNRIVDFSINKDLFLIAAGKNGATKLLNADGGLSNIKQNLWKDSIKLIHFPTKDTIVYSTADGQAKTINMYDLLEYQNRSQANEFSKSPTHTQISLDTSNNIGVAHWTNNEQLSEEERTTIYVSRINNNEREYFQLHTSFDESTYDSISNAGQLEEHASHFLTATFYNTTIIALATTGEVSVWHLPPIQIDQPNLKEYSKNEDQENAHYKPKSDYRHLDHLETKTHSSRSNSPKQEIHKPTTKKSLNLMKITTPRRSLSSSPADSPREKSSTEPKL